VRVPALRERGDDVLLLADHFLDRLARRLQRDAKELDADARRALREYDWPGNVRELEHALEHAFILSRGKVIHAADLPFQSSTCDPVPGPSSVSAESGAGAGSGGRGLALSPSLFELPYAEAKKRALNLFDEAYMAAVLERTSGNMSEAARKAGLDRSNFRRIARKSREG
jgi:DNA-binding NtrC family response regulator